MENLGEGNVSGDRHFGQGEEGEDPGKTVHFR